MDQPGARWLRQLAEAGHRVLLLDKAGFPRHKPCSDYVNAGGRKILAEIGVLDEVMRAGAHPIDGMVVHAPDGNRFAADFAKAEPGACALGLSRRCLDQLLLDRARAAGVTVCERTRTSATSFRTASASSVSRRR